VIATGLVLLAGTWLAALANARPDAPIESRLTALPAAIGAWMRVSDWEGSDRPLFAGTDEQGTGRYVLGASHVNVFLGRYVVQKQGKEAVYYSNRPGGHSEVRASGSARVELAGEEHVSLSELEVADPDGGRRVVWYAYEIAGSRARDAFRAKLFQVAGAFVGRWDAQVIVASSRCEPDCGAAREALADIMMSGYRQVLTSAAKEKSE
jgi:EpsI family protein